MNIIVCIDDDNGMMFNRRRQSRDKAIIQDIINTVSKNRLFMDKYSASLFADYDVEVIAERSFLSKADECDYCFVENKKLRPYKDKINSVIVYKWYRQYPSDMKLDIEPSEGRVLVSSVEFAGYSHEKITKEVYSR